MPTIKPVLRHETTWLRSYLEWGGPDVAFERDAMREMHDAGVYAVDLQEVMRTMRVVGGEPNEGPLGEAYWEIEGEDADGRSIRLGALVCLRTNMIRIVKVRLLRD